MKHRKYEDSIPWHLSSLLLPSQFPDTHRNQQAYGHSLSLVSVF